MQIVDYNTVVEIPRSVLWDFIKEFSNWAPMIKGYQTHEMVNDKESLWTIKGEFGPFSRTSKFRTVITEWVDNERVAFELKGVNEPVVGFGKVNLETGSSPESTSIVSQVGFNAGGALGPLINRLVKPYVQTVAGELVPKLVAAVAAKVAAQARA